MKKLFTIAIAFLITGVCYGQNLNVNQIDIDKEIQGDLYQNSAKSSTLAILVPGSGPTDRNGNQLPYIKANSYLLLAQEIAKLGIDVFTYDKRIIAQIRNRTVDESKLVFQDNVTDLQLVVNHFSQQYEKIALVGHSEGSLIALLAANQTPGISKVVSLQGIGQTSDVVLSKQISAQAPHFKKQVDSIHKLIKQGQTVVGLNPNLAAVYRVELQPYLRSWFAEDPYQEAYKLKQPLLIVQGGTDLQVDLSQAELLHQANPQAEFKVIEKMNHVLKDIDDPKDNLRSYADDSIDINKEVGVLIVRFLEQ